MGVTRSRGYGTGVQAMPLLQGRVPQQTFDAFHAAARGSGVSMAYYFEALHKHLEAQGGFPVVPKPVSEPTPIDFNELEARTDAA